MIKQTLHVNRLTGIAIQILMVLLSASLHAEQSSTSATLQLQYDQPAQDWKSEALPIGNGRLGGMVFGGINKEHIQFNEDSLWIGDEGDTGAYQAFGDIYVEMDHPPAPQSYSRVLDIENALHKIEYNSDGINYKREYFASYPAQVIVFRFSADKKGSQSGTVTLTDAHKATISVKDNTITALGDLSAEPPYKGKRKYDVFLDYASQLRVLHEGGSIAVDNTRITFRNCDTVTILLAADTNYINQREKGWRTGNPLERISKQLDAASKKSYDVLKKEHIEDYRSLFGRLTLNLGASSEESRKKGLVDRLKAFEGEKKGASVDPEFEVLYFQLARYLMISCSRPGALPANLQGLWNNSNKPPWRCDYHTDVNVQMNYWFVDQANLSECFQPLAEYINSIRAVRRDETKKTFGTRGWMTHSENGIFGGSTYRWVPGDASWVAQNIWDHFAFTQDKRYLKKYAYPLMKELCEFWEDYLIEGPEGKLLSQASQSPEHGPVAKGNSYDQQLAWDVFSNYIEASTILDIDEEFRNKVKGLQSRLLGPQIGRWGQLQEWAKDIDDPKNKHRHLSHLIAVYPGRQISLSKTPRLAEAAKVSLNARGDGAAGWSISWKSCLWARLGDGNRAYRILRTKTRLHKDGVFPNLMSGVWNYFQIESHFGYAAGLCEMLVQSHVGTIHLLPALPDAWPSGKVTGICARGGVTVDMEWKDGKVVDYRLMSEIPKKVRVRIDGKDSSIMTEELN